MKIIPAIDILDGSCVRLIKGDFGKVTKYESSPLKQSNYFKEEGFYYLHIIDLNAASTNSMDNLAIIKKIASTKDLKIQVGGGVRSMDRVDMLFSSGVDRVIVGTGAIENSYFLDQLRECNYLDKIIFALDFKVINKLPMLATHGWSVESEINLYDYLSKNNWIKNILATDISLDGTMKGPNKEIYKNIISLNTFKFIASGGIGSVNDLHYLKSIGADECVVGKAIYEKKISMMDLKNVN